jgi:hypothetical protein
MQVLQYPHHDRSLHLIADLKRMEVQGFVSKNQRRGKMP